MILALMTIVNLFGNVTQGMMGAWENMGGPGETRQTQGTRRQGNQRTNVLRIIANFRSW